MSKSGFKPPQLKDKNKWYDCIYFGNSNCILFQSLYLFVTLLSSFILCLPNFQHSPHPNNWRVFLSCKHSPLLVSVLYIFYFCLLLCSVSSLHVYLASKIHIRTMSEWNVDLVFIYLYPILYSLSLLCALGTSVFFILTGPPSSNILLRWLSLRTPRNGQQQTNC